MEKFLLGGVLTGNKLNVVDEEQIGFPIFAAELDVSAAADGLNQVVGKFVALDIYDFCFRCSFPDAVGNGVQKVGLANTGRAVNKQRIIDHTGGLTDCHSGAVRKPVGRADHKVIKGKLGIKVHRGGNLILILESFQFPVA